MKLGRTQAKRRYCRWKEGQILVKEGEKNDEDEHSGAVRATLREGRKVSIITPSPVRPTYRSA
jgi:hypothetical protein